MTTQSKGLHGLLAPHSEKAYAAMRIVIGLMFSFHGVQKIFGILSEFQPPAGSQIWFGGIIELVAGLLIALGLATTYAAFLASGTMAVAYIQFHWQGQFGAALLPGINKGELALAYSFIFLFIATKGAGIWSIDHARSR